MKQCLLRSLQVVETKLSQALILSMGSPFICETSGFSAHSISDILRDFVFRNNGLCLFDCFLVPRLELRTLRLAGRRCTTELFPAMLLVFESCSEISVATVVLFCFLAGDGGDHDLDLSLAALV